MVLAEPKYQSFHHSSADKLVRPEDMLAYARGVDLSLSRVPPAAPPHAPHAPAAPNGAPLALSVRDAPTINSLIARAQPRHPHSRVDALLERLAPVSPHSVIVHPRAGPSPSPPSSNDDSADSCGAPPGAKRKRKPDRTVRVPSAPPPPEALFPKPAVEALETPKETSTRLSPPKEAPATPVENGEAHRNGPEPPDKEERPEAPHTRRKSRSRSAETIDDIAAMIASTDNTDGKDTEPETVPDPPAIEAMEPDAPVTIDKLKSVLASPNKRDEEPKSSPPREEPQVEAAAAPKRRSARANNSESTNVPVESPSEAKAAEPDTSEVKSAEPTPASIVDVEDQLEKMFAGIEEDPDGENAKAKTEPKGKKRRKSAPTKGEKKCSRRSSRASTGDERSKKKGGKKAAPKQKKAEVKDAYAYDSGSNASSGRSRGPYIQVNIFVNMYLKCTPM